MTASPLTPDEIAAVRKPYRAASLLPGRAYHDPAIHDFERTEWFRRDWIVVGREEDAPAPGTYFLAEVDDEALIVVRGRDGVLRGFYNVCRHRGAELVAFDAPRCAHAGSVIRCPYHAWTYGLDGRLRAAPHLERGQAPDVSLHPVAVDAWGGFVVAACGAADGDVHFAIVFDSAVDCDDRGGVVAVVQLGGPHGP